MVRIFRDYGYRRLRNKARLKFLLAEWGTEKFRQVLQDEYLGYALPDGPAPAPASAPGDHIGVHEQKDGRRYVGLAPTVGRISGTTLKALVEAVERAGSGRIRLTPHQKLVVLDVDPGKVDALVAEVEPLGLTADHIADTEHHGRVRECSGGVLARGNRGRADRAECHATQQDQRKTITRSSDLTFYQ